MVLLCAAPTLVDDEPERWVVSVSVSCRLNESVPEDVCVEVPLPPAIVALEPIVTVSTPESVPVIEDDSLVVNVEVAVRPVIWDELAPPAWSLALDESVSVWVLVPVRVLVFHPSA